ncbi:MAG: PAS domain S-box protein [Gammaproteobacteria bacterium]|nr:PAS domain S-box protein [Gammaproteobacteria bacterium]
MNAPDDLLLEAARVISGARVETVYADLIRAATDLLDCQLGIIGRYVMHEDVPSIEMLACYADGRFMPNAVYPLAGTPCETVVGQEFRFYPRNVGFLFPEVRDEDPRLESYAAYPLFDRDRQPIGIITVMSFGELADRDRAESLLRLFAQRAVTELERDAAAAALRASEEQYRAIFNASVDGVVMLRLDGTIVDVNPAIERLYGYQRDELLGRQVLDVLAVNRREAARDFLRRVLAEGYAQTEDHATRKDGSEFFCEPRAVLMDYQGACHVLAIVRDITRERQRERALHRSEDLLRATVESALDCIVAMDAHGRTIEFNPAAERCFGYRKADALGRPLAELIIPKRFRAEHRAGIEHYLATGAGLYIDQRREVIAMRADGEEFPVELAIGIARGAPGPVFIGYLRDITERHAAEYERQVLEGQLRQAQKMEAIGQLTGGIAHDFNNILTSMLGYVELAAERLGAAGEGADERLPRYLERARRSGERARDLVQQMLTFSRGQQGEPRSLDLAHAVEEGMQLLESTMPATLHIDTRLARDLPPVVVDPVHVEQVLVNLCINARDAMDGVGRLSVSVARAEVARGTCSSCRHEVAGDAVELVVADDGPGIAADIVERMFEPFFSTKASGRGSGMGLSSVHGIVHEYGGHVVVETAPGAGARFRVSWPIEDAIGARAEPRASLAGERSRTVLRGRVLLVDDNRGVAEFLEELLASWGLDVVVAHDGMAALERFGSTGAFDLVITDQTMPGMTGFELGRQLLERQADLPVVLYSGYAESLNEAQVQAAGLRALVRKPLDLARFKALLAGLLGTAA